MATNDELFTALQTVITAMQPSIDLVRNFQSIQSGRAANPTIYVCHVSDTNVGFQQRRFSPSMVESLVDYQESQLVESAFQFSAINQNIEPIKQLNRVVQSLVFIERMRALGIGVRRVSQIRMPTAANDNNQFEIDASFDLILTHSHTLELTDNAIGSYNVGLHRI